MQISNLLFKSKRTKIICGKIHSSNAIYEYRNFLLEIESSTDKKDEI